LTNKKVREQEEKKRQQQLFLGGKKKTFLLFTQNYKIETGYSDLGDQFPIQPKVVELAIFLSLQQKTLQTQEKFSKIYIHEERAM
tara:strand:+ start:83 stop:337 length:255 start_codon:yes stop_codon:yes gene_type:complete